MPLLTLSRIYSRKTYESSRAVNFQDAGDWQVLQYRTKLYLQIKLYRAKFYRAKKFKDFNENNIFQMVLNNFQNNS